MTETANLGLQKPGDDGVLDIKVIDANMDIIDGAVAGKSESGHTHTPESIGALTAGNVSEKYNTGEKIGNKIDDCLKLGYEYAGVLSERSIVESEKVYLAYTDDTEGTLSLCNLSKDWTLGDDNPDSDFSEFTAKVISDKIKILSTENFDETVLFDGVKSSTGILTLSENWDNYKKIMIVGRSSVNANGLHNIFYTNYITPNDSTSTQRDGELNLWGVSSAYIRGLFRDTNRNEIYITERNDGGNIYKVIGIGKIG
jgi:hypothetical protein